MLPVAPGGVLVGGLIHGNSGTGSPLSPRVYNYAAFWGVGTLAVADVEQVRENRVVHFMTTQTARDREYALGVDEEMPLEDPFLGRAHHTHGFVFPIEMTAHGPRFVPLDTPSPADGEEDQPFIHVVFDVDDVTIAAGDAEETGAGG